MAIRNTFLCYPRHRRWKLERHRDFAWLVASPMSCFCLTCLPCLKSPCQLEGEALPTWRFTARRVRSAYSSRECSRNAAVELPVTMGCI
jgi:hypothetical protein